MKSIILLLLVATPAIVKAADSADEAQLAREVAGDATALRELLAENWTVQSKENEITIPSKFDVFFIGLISHPGPAPQFSDKTSRKEVNRAGGRTANVRRDKTKSFLSLHNNPLIPKHETLPQNHLFHIGFDLCNR